MVKRIYSAKMKGCARDLRKKSTPQEKILWRHLRNSHVGVKFRRQVAIHNKYIVDFVCLEKKLIIEVDGSQHAQSTTDRQRDEYLQAQGFEIIRFWNNEVNNQLVACLELIYSKCKATPSPALRASSPSRG